MPKTAGSTSVPRSMQAIYEAITTLTDAFCCNTRGRSSSGAADLAAEARICGAFTSRSAGQIPGPEFVRRP